MGKVIGGRQDEEEDDSKILNVRMTTSRHQIELNKRLMTRMASVSLQLISPPTPSLF
jgi:hypothetical protein